MTQATTDTPNLPPAEEVNPPTPHRAPNAVTYTPNVIPLIDVLFLLMLFFLLSTSFRKEEIEIPGTLPAIGDKTPSGADKVEPNPIYINVHYVATSNVQFEVDGKVYRTVDELYGALDARKRALQTTNIKVFIQPGDDVPWENTVDAYNQAVRVQFKQIGFSKPAS